LASGDIVIGLQGAAVRTVEELRERLGGASAGSTLTFRLWRQGETVDLQLTMPEPERAGPTIDPPVDRSPEAEAAADWLQAVGGETAWVILLEGEPRESVKATTTAAPSTAAADLFAPPPGLGSFTLADGRGSVEVQQRGGREHVIVRNAQGSVMYEGPMETEADRVWLRPLAPVLREAVVGFVEQGPPTSTPGPVRVWRWEIPSPYL
jgi:hypothetical protein